MIHDCKIKGTPEVYTIAVNCCSQSCDWDFASSVYQDMTKNGVQPDEVCNRDGVKYILLGSWMIQNRDNKLAS